jgi:hypothetical protein
MGTAEDGRSAARIAVERSPARSLKPDNRQLKLLLYRVSSNWLTKELHLIFTVPQEFKDVKLWCTDDNIFCLYNSIVL